MSNLTIWKFPLEVTDEQVIEIPDHARLLTVQAQYERPCLWAVVDPGMPKVPTKVLIYGTGHPCSEVTSEYVGTFQLGGGHLVFHVFVLPTSEEDR